jgi:hypothetical protein
MSINHEFCVYIDDSLFLSLLKKPPNNYYFLNFCLRNDHFTFRSWGMGFFFVKNVAKFYSRKNIFTWKIQTLNYMTLQFQNKFW